MIPWLALSGALALAVPAQAQENGDPPGTAQQVGQAQTGLPEPAVTRHSIETDEGMMHFKARAGALTLRTDRGEPRADIAYVAYMRTADGEADPDPTRPVTFAVNGGPGAASAYLHIGVLGPWRLPMDAQTISPSQDITLVDNAETWLDFTDLVFVDPVGTGFSRLAENDRDSRNAFLSVDGDIEALSDFVADWLRERGRTAAPVYFVGESYGGFRGPLLADRLQSETGIALSGMTLVSPVLDFGWREQPAHAPLPRVSLLPSLAAAAMERDGGIDEEALREAEAYAEGEFLADLLRGPGDEQAVERLVDNVTRLTGLDRDLVERHGGRLDMQLFAREFARDDQRIASIYDSGVTSDDPFPQASFSRAREPVLDAMTAPLTRAMLDLYAGRLEWMPERRYILLNNGVNRAWDFGSGRRQPEALSALARTMALDPAFDVLVVHGLTDLVTPYFETHLVLRQLRPFGPGERLREAHYPGGHMFYNRDDSRAAFLGDGRWLYGVE
ncbi:MAG: peptidase S10 [Salinarimonas sp.]|nr:peptidase S10 [Salinarimonas sp.]